MGAVVVYRSWPHHGHDSQKMEVKRYTVRLVNQSKELIDGAGTAVLTAINTLYHWSATRETGTDEGEVKEVATRLKVFTERVHKVAPTLPTTSHHDSSSRHGGGSTVAEKSSGESEGSSEGHGGTVEYIDLDDPTRQDLVKSKLEALNEVYEEERSARHTAVFLLGWRRPQQVRTHLPCTVRAPTCL